MREEGDLAINMQMQSTRTQEEMNINGVKGQSIILFRFSLITLGFSLFIYEAFIILIRL